MSFHFCPSFFAVLSGNSASFMQYPGYTKWWPNQFRGGSLLLPIFDSIRRETLKGTELENAYVSTIRLKLFKIGAVLLRNTRRIRFLLTSNYPYQNLFRLVVKRLVPG